MRASRRAVIAILAQTTATNPAGAAELKTAASCMGMATCKGFVKFSVTPTAAPIVEFGIDGVNWPYSTTIQANPVSATLYTWNIPIEAVKFVRVRYTPNNGTIQGSVTLHTDGGESLSV